MLLRAARLLTVLALAAALAGCGPVPATPPAAPPSPPAQDAEEAGSPGVYRFDATHDDAITTTVARLREDSAGPWAAPVQDAPIWAVEVTFTNNLPQPFDPGVLLQVKGYVDDRVAQEVFDHANGFPGVSVTGPLAPGQTVTVPVAFTGAAPEARYRVSVSALDGTNTATWAN